MRNRKGAISKAALIWLVCIGAWCIAGAVTSIMLHGRIERPIIGFILWPLAIIACLIRGKPEAASEMLGAVALLPLWIRLVILWVAVGLGLTAYEARVALGDGVAKAIGQVVLGGLVKPVTFIYGLFSTTKT